MAAPTEIALFAGAGGGCLASVLLGHRIVCYVERDHYCVDVLRARIADGMLDDAPIWDDVRTFDGSPWRGLVDIVSAGFPCQPFSVASSPRESAQMSMFPKGRVADDDRNRWPDTARIIGQVAPAAVFLENVPGLLGPRCRGYFGRILSDLSSLGYRARWGVVSAADVGAPHVRKRLWIVAARDARGRLRYERRLCVQSDPDPYPDGRGQQEVGLEGRESGLESARGDVIDGLCGPWATKPGMDRVVDVVARRVDRLRATGNGQVPLVAATAWHLLTEES